MMFKSLSNIQNFSQKIRFFIILTLFHSLANCKSTPLENLSSTVSEKIEGSTQLTFSGNNRFPNSNSQFNKVLFASSSRLVHKNFQIYELNLNNNTEDRITYNDGVNLDPKYSPDEKVIYFQSTSDEQKDFPEKLFTSEYNFTPQKFWNFENSNLFLNSEIYYYLISDKITPPQRLTQRLGFDGFVNPVDMINSSWISKSKDQFIITSNNLKTKKSIPFFTQTMPIWKPQWVEHSKQWFWISWTTKNPIPTLFNFDLSKKGTSPINLNLPQGNYHDFFVLNNLMIISAKLANDVDYEIYIYQFESKCLFKYFSHKGDEVDGHLNFSDKLNRMNILFSSRKDSDINTPFQIYKAEYAQPQTPTCLK